MAKRKRKKDEQWLTKTTKMGMDSGAPGGYTIPAPLVTTAVLLLLQTRSGIVITTNVT
jgi:hypothetical protein